MAFIEARGLSKSFPARGGARAVLRDVTLSIDRGEFVSVVGMMGSGKSTLLAMVAGLVEPDAGDVTIGGEPVRGVRRKAAYVFQNYSLLPWFTALENVRLAVEAACPSVSRAEQKARAARALEQVGLGQALAKRPGQLSGGMRQRVAIARAFAIDPDVLFMDEPFGALDALTRAALQQELVNLCSAVAYPVTTLMITNSVDEAILLSDRIVPVLGGPPATLGHSVRVDLPRPRSAASLAHDETAARVRARIVGSLTSAAKGRVRGQAQSAAAPGRIGVSAPEWS